MCGIKHGKSIESFKNHDTYRSFGNGEAGGNIDGLPGGLCLIGSNISSKYAEQFCGSTDNVVQIEVDWLMTGHVDEIFKVIPNHRDGVPPECGFSLMFASPAKAIELIKEPRVGNYEFFRLEGQKHWNDQQIQEFRKSRSNRATGSKICEIYRKYLDNTTPSEGNSSNKTRSVFFNILRNLLLSNSYANGTEQPCHPDKLKNRHILKAIEDDSKLRDYNLKVQETMDRAKASITQKILERLPQCRKYLSTIDAPNLFFGRLTEFGSRSGELPNFAGDGRSINPNPTNSVVSNKTMIFPDPQNPIFRDYLSSEMNKNGLKSSFLDTWDYAHIGEGNLHCATQSIRYCKPIAKGTK